MCSPLWEESLTEFQTFTDVSKLVNNNRSKTYVFFLAESYLQTSETLFDHCHLPSFYLLRVFPNNSHVSLPLFHRFSVAIQRLQCNHLQRLKQWSVQRAGGGGWDENFKEQNALYVYVCLPCPDTAKVCIFFPQQEKLDQSQSCQLMNTLCDLQSFIDWVNSALPEFLCNGGGRRREPVGRNIPGAVHSH